MLINVSYPVLPILHSVRASLVMDHFGISHDTREHVLARDLEVPLQPGDVVLFNGASGSGKSSLLRAVLRQLESISPSTGDDEPRRHGGTEKRGTETEVVDPQDSTLASTATCPLSHAINTHPAGQHLAEERARVRGPVPSPKPSSPSVPPCLRGSSKPTASPNSVNQLSTLNPQLSTSLLIDLPTLPLGSQSLVDAIPLPFEEALQLLAMCGLGEAPLLLRTPQELSEGQRYRFSLALAVSQKPQWIVADEFTAVLDRTTAKVIAYNVRRIADRYGVGFLLATAQHDIADDLSPDLSVTCDLDGRVSVSRRNEEADRNACSTSSCSPLPQGEGPGVSAEQPDTVLAPSNTDPGRPGKPVLLPSLNPQRSTLNAQPRKKKDHPSASTATSGSVLPPVATGRISLGGIIAVTTSG